MTGRRYLVFLGLVVPCLSFLLVMAAGVSWASAYPGVCEEDGPACVEYLGISGVVWSGDTNLNEVEDEGDAFAQVHCFRSNDAAAAREPYALWYLLENEESGLTGLGGSEESCDLLGGDSYMALVDIGLARFGCGDLPEDVHTFGAVAEGGNGDLCDPPPDDEEPPVESGVGGSLALQTLQTVAMCLVAVLGGATAGAVVFRRG